MEVNREYAPIGVTVDFCINRSSRIITQLQQTGTHYQSKMEEEQLRMKKAWEPIAKELAGLQDEQKGTEGLAQLMEVVIGM
jgi:hypothetical protein